MASGGTDVSNIDISPLYEAYVLYGGIIGGPDQFDNFTNIRSNWSQTEVSIMIPFSPFPISEHE
jgi:endoglucanase